MKEPSKELKEAFKAWKKISDLEIPLYLKLEEEIDKHLGPAKKDDRIERGKVIVELSRTPQSPSISTGESTTLEKSTQAGSKPRKTKVKKTQASSVASSPTPTPAELKNAND